jgi:hypothetical protein
MLSVSRTSDDLFTMPCLCFQPCRSTNNVRVSEGNCVCKDNYALDKTSPEPTCKCPSEGFYEREGQCWVRLPSCLLAAVSVFTVKVAVFRLVSELVPLQAIPACSEANNMHLDKDYKCMCNDNYVPDLTSHGTACVCDTEGFYQSGRQCLVSTTSTPLLPFENL